MLKLLKTAVLSAALLAFSLVGASALYVDQTKIPPARDFHTQMVHYYRLTINWNDAFFPTAQRFGTLPNNAYILSIDADVTTAFNAGTTNVITIGATLSSHNEIVASGITAGSTGIYHLTSAAGLGVAVTGNSSYQNSSNSAILGVPLYADYVQTGTAATAGSVTIVIAYVPNNDL